MEEIMHCVFKNFPQDAIESVHYLFFVQQITSALLDTKLSEQKCFKQMIQTTFRTLEAQIR